MDIPQDFVERIDATRRTDSCLQTTRGVYAEHPGRGGAESCSQSRPHRRSRTGIHVLIDGKLPAVVRGDVRVARRGDTVVRR